MKRLHYAASIVTMLICFTGCQPAQPYQYTATILSAPMPVGDFTFGSTAGGEFRLSEHGSKLLLLFFGYTNCPDVCPATLYQLQAAMDRLEADAGQVEVIFITVDPARDTLDRLGEYLASFDPAFIGLRTDSPDELTGLAKQFGIFYDLGSADEHVEAYLVMHTSSILVLRNSAFIATFPPDTPADDMVRDIRQMLREK